MISLEISGVKIPFGCHNHIFTSQVQIPGHSQETTPGPPTKGAMEEKMKESFFCTNGAKHTRAIL
jgi:hypothetical protein